jgi:hypothetical protein
VRRIALPSTMTVRWWTRTANMSEISTKTVDQTETLSAFATLRFSGDRLEPDRITAILGVEPTTAYRKGDVYRRSRGHEVRGRTGVWYVSTRRCVHSNDLADHFRHLVAVVCPEGRADHIAALRDLMARDGVEADVSCFWYGSAGALSPEIPAFARDIFTRLGATIETDFDTD